MWTHWTRRFALLLLFVLALGSGSAAAAAAGEEPPRRLTGELDIQDLAGSSVEAVPVDDCYEPHAQTTICFRVRNASQDAEWINRVRLTFPAGWTPTCDSQAAADSSGWPVDMQCTVDNPNSVLYADNDGSADEGEITSGATWDICVRVLATGSNVGGPRPVPWVLQGDAGSLEKDHHSLVLEECRPLRLFPDRLDVEGCNGLEQTHTLALHNRTSQPTTVDLSYAVPEDKAEFAGAPPASFQLSGGGLLTFTVGLKPRVWLEPGDSFTATISAQSSVGGDQTGIVHTVTEYAGWESWAATPSAATDNVVVWARHGDGGLWSIGGFGSGGAAQRYDPGTDTWTSYASQATVAPEIEYPMDGCYGLNAAGDEVVVLFPDTIVTGTLQVFNITDRSWYTETIQSAYPPEGRWAQDIVSLLAIPDEFMKVDGNRNVCYLSGGATRPGGGRTRDLWVYYPATNSSNYLDPFFEEMQDPPVFNFHASWYVPWVGTQGGICVAGGIDFNSQMNTATQCYDLAEGDFNSVNADLGELPVPWWGMADGWVVEDGQYELWMANGVDRNAMTVARSLYFNETEGQFQYGPDTPQAVYRQEGTGFEDHFVVLQGATSGLAGLDRHVWLSACPACQKVFLPLVLRH